MGATSVAVRLEETCELEVVAEAETEVPGTMLDADCADVATASVLLETDGT